MKTYRKSELLIEVKRRLKKNIKTHPFGICSLLNDMSTEYEYSDTTENIFQLKKWVMGLLGEYAYYDQWLKYKRPSKFKKLTGLNPDKWYPRTVAHEGRLQWLDWMIEIHKEAEDIADDKTPKTRHINAKSSDAFFEIAKRYRVKK